MIRQDHPELIPATGSPRNPPELASVLEDARTREEDGLLIRDLVLVTVPPRKPQLSILVV